VAVRKGTKRKVPVKTTSRRKQKASSSGRKIPWAVIFWVGFIILLLVIYLINRETINNNFLMMQRIITSRNVPEEPITEPIDPEGTTIQVPPPTQNPFAQPEAPTTTTTPAPEPVEPPEATPLPPTGQVSEPQSNQPETIQDQQAVQGTAETRDRTLYFILVDREGSVLSIKIDRRLPVSESPLRDVIQALIDGPNDEEKQRGLISLIPRETKILSITIRGDTAYINFSEDFQYSIYGLEGYTGQLWQIVYTATEFSNISDVQILIEGRRVDYLGEGVWIGSPLSREML